MIVINGVPATSVDPRDRGFAYGDGVFRTVALRDGLLEAWPQQWAKAYVDFAHREKRDYLRALGLRSLPFVGWAERGDGRATGCPPTTSPLC